MTDPLEIGEDIITKPNPSFALRFKMTSFDDIADGLGAMGGGQDLGRPVVLMLDSLLLRKLSACCIFRSLFSRYGFVLRARCVSSIQSATCLSLLMLSVSDFRRSRLFITLVVTSLVVLDGIGAALSL